MFVSDTLLLYALKVENISSQFFYISDKERNARFAYSNECSVGEWLVQ